MWISKIRAGAGNPNDRSPFGGFWFGPVGTATPSRQRVTPDTALGLAAVWASVRVLSESFAVLPFRLYRSKRGGGRAQVTDHWLYRVIAKAPNQFQSPFEWREMLQGHVALRGNAYCQIAASSAGEITALLPLHPDRMTVETLAGGEYRYAYRQQDGSIIRYTRGEIFHIRGLSSDGIMGMSPIEVARNALGEGLALQDYSARFFANDAKPGGGWIEYPGKFATPDAKKRFRESWQDLQGGANQNKVAVLENGMKYHELGMKNSDAQFIEARAAKVSEVARIFRIPPHKIGDLAKATFSNIEQQSIEFWQDTMLPWTERWESQIGYQLLGPDSDLEVDFDMRRMMRADSTARGAYYNNGIMSGWLTRNEAREEEGLDPLDGLDEPLRPLNMAEQDDGVDDGVPSGGAAPAAPEPPAEPKPAPKKKASAERMHALLAGNARRMSRRIVSGSVPDAAVLADALAIDVDTAAVWLACRQDASEDEITAQLIALGEQD